ncbi:MAG TPA: hypothetical protein VGB17_04950 [Pyrinomonadaceae bacterium]|jgi:hypothetical protein
MRKNTGQQLKRIGPDLLTGWLIFITTLLIFWFSPVHQVTDSNYSMLLSESLYRYRSFALDHYNLKRFEPTYHDGHIQNGSEYHMDIVGGRFYYYFPPGSSILSIPYVALMNALGLSAANADGTYNIMGEIKLERSLASLLMAALTAIFYLTARLLLPRSWSLIIALGAALGTQVWSTASRALWNDTWGIVLLGIVLLMLLAEECGRHRLRPFALATLLAWTYFVRPTYSVAIIAISIYLLLYYRALFVVYALTGLGWLALFILYSWIHFNSLLPAYYRTSRLGFNSFGEALAGNLLSPARGLLLYVPLVLFIAYLVWRYRKFIEYGRLAWLASTVVLAHLLVISGFSPWWGGASYGPRFMTGLVPWFVLLAILGVEARLRALKEQREKGTGKLVQRAELWLGVLLLAQSVFANARGALSAEPWIWFMVVDEPGAIAQLWDWRQPQFLVGLIYPPLPHEFPRIEPQTRIDFTKKESDKYLWYGWSGPEPEYRWSDKREAAVIFADGETGDLFLKIKLGPMLIPGKVEEQVLQIDLNGQPLQTFSLRERKAYELSLKLPSNLLRQKNVLRFGLPNATSLSSLGESPDQRRLGISVQWIELQTLLQAQ